MKGALIILLYVLTIACTVAALAKGAKLVDRILYMVMSVGYILIALKLLGGVL